MEGEVKGNRERERWNKKAFRERRGWGRDSNAHTEPF